MRNLRRSILTLLLTSFGIAASLPLNSCFPAREKSNLEKKIEQETHEIKVFPMTQNPNMALSTEGANPTTPGLMKKVTIDLSNPDSLSPDYWSQRVNCLPESDWQTAIREVKTPLEAAIYCNNVLLYTSDEELYNTRDYWASFKQIHAMKRDDCEGGAFAAAALLSDDGFPPYIMMLHKEKETGHAVFVYRNQDGKFGSVGIHDTDFSNPVYDRIEELAEQISKGLKSEFRTYEIFDFSRAMNRIMDRKGNGLITFKRRTQTKPDTK